MSLVAIIPAEHLLSANEALEAQGFGPSNFSVISYSSGRATHATLHAWPDPAFTAAVTALPNVAYDIGEGDPITRTRALIESQGAQWGADAPEYGGTLTAGTLYRYSDRSLWYCIQPFDTAVYSAHPSTYPALIRCARRPGVAEPWVQPLDQHDAYRLLDPFTGAPDECTHKSKDWRTRVDNNVREPGVPGSENLWEQISSGQVPDPEPEPPPDEWPAWKPWDGNNANLYQVGAKVSHNGKRWVSNTPNNHWEPGVFGWVEQP